MLKIRVSGVQFRARTIGSRVNAVVVSGETRSGFGPPYNGIEAIVVEDREWVDEECTGDYVLVETTEDWFVQDGDGNLWYLGEDTTSWDGENDCLSTGGAWEPGEDGAQAAVVIPGSPAVGKSYRQKYYEGEAEDRANVLRLNARVSIEFGEFNGCLKTKEYTPLELGKVEHKYHCRLSEGGFGLMLVEEPKGKTRRVEYVGATLPGGLPDEFPTTDVCTE